MKKVSLILLFTFSLVVTACQPNTQVNEVDSTPLIEEQAVVLTETLPSEEVTAEPPTSTPTATEVPVISIVVSTEQDVVDGDTSQIDALIAAPGSDGLISLREAINAANQTSGPKLISFSPDLKGEVIVLGQVQSFEDPRLLVTMDQITVNGDVDGDGIGDITLDGTALDSNYSSAFVLNASQVTIENLQITGFTKFAIMICCVDDHCADRTYQQIVIRNNIITSVVGGGGIVLTPLKLTGDVPDPTLFSNISFSDIQFLGNTITVSNGGNGGIFIAAAGAGGSDNRLEDIIIQGNTVSSPGANITVNGGDGSSLYFGYSGEEIFSDRNIVERLTISSNYMDPAGIGGDGSRPAGIVLISGNYGNSENVIRDVVISENEVTSNAEYFAYLNPTSNGVVVGLPMTTRAATDNVIENVEIVDNVSYATTAAITLLASSGEAPAPVGATGRVSNVWIHGNQIFGYKWEGIDIFAGVGESGNLIEDVAIEDNLFTALDITKGQALFIYAGGCSGCERVSDNNHILGLVIRNNTLNGNDFIFMYAGMEDYATNNTVEYFLGENSLTPTDATMDIVDFCGKENGGNLMQQLEQAP